MAKPIPPIPVFKGEAARWLTEYLNRVPTEEELEARRVQREADRAAVARLVPLDELRRQSTESQPISYA